MHLYIDKTTGHSVVPSVQLGKEHVLMLHDKDLFHQAALSFLSYKQG